MPHSCMALHTTDRIAARGAAPEDHVGNIAMASQAVALQISAVLRLDHDRFMKILERKPS